MKITGRIQNTYQVWAKFSSVIIVCTQWRAGYQAARTNSRQMTL